MHQQALTTSTAFNGTTTPFITMNHFILNHLQDSNKYSSKVYSMLYVDAHTSRRGQKRKQS